MMKRAWPDGHMTVRIHSPVNYPLTIIPDLIHHPQKNFFFGKTEVERKNLGPISGAQRFPM